MELQEFARCATADAVEKEAMEKDAGLGRTALTGAKALGAAGAPTSLAKLKLMGQSLKGTGQMAGKDLKGALAALKGKAGAAGEATGKFFGSPVKSIKELRRIGAEKGWSPKDLLKVIRGEKLVGAGARSDTAREAVKGLAANLRKGAVRAGAIGAGAGAAGGLGYALGKKK